MSVRLDSTSPLPSSPERHDAGAGDADHDACGIVLLADVGGQRSHDLLARGLEALRRLTHRGSSGRRVSAIDGCGVLTNIPWRLLDRESGASLPRELRALGAFFVPRGGEPAFAREMAPLARDEGWSVRRWRAVPTRQDMLHEAIRPQAPDVLQAELVWRGAGRPSYPSLWRLWLRLRHRLAVTGLDATVLSLSTETVVYKALVTPEDLPRFYGDLVDARFEAATVVAHQRFSTNTDARWALAQPFQALAHNGEINTIAGNRAWMRARCRSQRVVPSIDGRELGEIVATAGSDSETLDDAVALLRASGSSLPRAVARLQPPAWEHDAELPASQRALHAYDALACEPWEGPAALVFTDGTTSGASLDRNGFRPLRWLRTSDGRVAVASEAGVLDAADQDVMERQRVRPGELLVVDAASRTLRVGHDVYATWAAARPYVEWHEQASRSIGRRAPSMPITSLASLRTEHRRFGYDREELELILKPLARDGAEAIGSMGDDTPPAALSPRPRLLFDFFRQRFAQVTNPPLDPLREAGVMSLACWCGRSRALGTCTAPERHVALLDTPVVSDGEFAELTRALPTIRLDATFAAAAGLEGFERAVEAMAAEARHAVESGAELVVLSDAGASPTRAPIPSALAVAAVMRHLRRHGLATDASLVVESGEARDPHHIAVLTSLGARAVFPWLAYRTAAALLPDDGAAAQARYRSGLEHGLLKIMAKMGVSTFAGYCGAHLVETLGLDGDLQQTFFGHAAAVPGGVTMARVHRDALLRHAAAHDDGELPHIGFHGYRKDGDYHAFNPEIVKALHRTARTQTGEAYRHFAALVAGRPATAPRDLLSLKPAAPVPLAEVEPLESICRRFFASAMSVGALAPEAHRVIALAMNEVGGRGNCGEGGEEAERAWPRRGPGSTNSTIKQIAAGRFGVTPAYLISADELQIKMAQGSKPGEGGQLPARKVVEHIARLRHTRPGTSLISPPPHHDIYSIEDLAQLIHDLQVFHPTARIGVKLVSQRGIGIVAAGVVKAGAHAIQISGHDGGTGASPRGSIKCAGLPWELGLLETHRLLTARGLRDHVALQVDGGCKTGVDVVKAALLGADEIGFGTALLVASGCVMARQCHADTCPVGIASQRPELRARFTGTASDVAGYLRLMAGHVRQLLASLGARRFDEIVGRSDLLVASEPPVESGFDWRAWLEADGQRTATPPARARATRAVTPAVPAERRATLNDRIVDACLPRLGRAPILFVSSIANTDLSAGVRLAGLVAERYGDAGSPEPIHLQFTGTAGQSFGAFALPGLHLGLVGEANDGVGKGMHGGSIAIRPSRVTASARRSDVLVGNSALYGATGGVLLVAGGAGERFAVRNSGALTVVEGVGDHACEYMTGGVVVVLGATGRNFGAGMSGGHAYVLDAADGHGSRMHTESVGVHAPTPEDARELRALLERHLAATRSRVARRLLARWPAALQRFTLVLPHADAESRRLCAESALTEPGASWTFASSRF